MVDSGVEGPGVFVAYADGGSARGDSGSAPGVAAEVGLEAHWLVDCDQARCSDGVLAKVRNCWPGGCRTNLAARGVEFGVPRNESV